MCNLVGFFKSVWSACGVAVGIRLCWIFLFPKKWWNNDSQFYFYQAERIAEGGWVYFFPNGYPLLIFVVNLLCGENRDVLVGILLGLNVCLATGSVWLVWDICRRLGGNLPCCALAAWVMALWPNQVNYAGQLMTEVPATFFLLLCFWLLLRGCAWGSGLSAFAMVSLRTALAPVAALWALWVVLSRKLHFSAVCLLMGTTLAFLMEWGGGVLSKHTEGQGNLGINFLIATMTEGGRLKVPSDLEIGTISTMEGAKVYLQSALNDPVHFLRQRLLALWELWGPWPDPGNWVSPVTGNVYGRSKLENLVVGLRFPLIVIALLLLWRERSNLDSLGLFSPVLVVTALHVVFYALPRYTFPAEPFIFLIVARGISKSRFFERWLEK